MAIRAPFLFAGFVGGDTPSSEYTYTDADLQGLGNATEFVVTCGGFKHYFAADGTPDSYYMQVYIDRAVRLANRLYTMYGKKIWIGTPMVDENVVDYNNAAIYNEVGWRLTYFVDNVIAAFGGEAVFKTRVKGFYMSNEVVLGKVTSVSTHPQIQMFQKLSEYVTRKGLKMLWAPMWSSENLTHMAKVIQEMSIFDYVLMQPNYYFTEQWHETACDSVRKSIIRQKVTFGDGSIASSKTSPRAVIGCQMEMDLRFMTTSPGITRGETTSFSERLQTYKTFFNGVTSGYSKAATNFGFYFGWPNEQYFDLCASDVISSFDAAKAEVNSFFA